MIFNKYQLSLHNPWWEDSYNISRDIKLVELQEHKFQYQHPLVNSFPNNQDVILTLRGPRQIGKTTLIKQIIQQLIGQDISRKNIFFMPCDRITDYNDLYLLIQDYITKTRIANNQQLYIFLDEISYVDQWQRAVKALADDGLLKQASMLLTGSNAFDLKKSSERLPGRTGKYFQPEILYLPLNFKQFYALVNPDWDGKINTLDYPRYKKYFDDYLLVGGFPHVINEFYQKNTIFPETYEIYTKWIDGDIFKEKKSPDSAYRLLQQIHKNLASRVSYTKLAKSASFASQQTAQDYLELLKLMFVLFECEYFSLDQQQVDPKKNKKIFFTDPFIHNAVIAKHDGFLSDAFNYTKKKLLRVENYNNRIEEVVGANIRAQYHKLYYGSFGKKQLEVDFVGFNKGQYQLIEVKYADSFSTENYHSLLDSSLAYQSMIVTSKSVKKTSRGIQIVPVWEYLLLMELGRG